MRRFDGSLVSAVVAGMRWMIIVLLPSKQLIIILTSKIINS